jgi:hypothetical protein
MDVHDGIHSLLNVVIGGRREIKDVDGVCTAFNADDSSIFFFSLIVNSLAFIGRKEVKEFLSV